MLSRYPAFVIPSCLSSLTEELAGRAGLTFLKIKLFGNKSWTAGWSDKFSSFVTFLCVFLSEIRNVRYLLGVKIKISNFRLQSVSLVGREDRELK